MHTGTRTIKFIFLDVVLDIFHTPVWWYTTGLMHFAKGLWNEARDFARILSLKILLRHLFTPMFGDYSKSGRVISFFVRFVQLMVYGTVMLLWVIALTVLLVLWLVIPVIVVYQFIAQFIPALPLYG